MRLANERQEFEMIEITEERLKELEEAERELGFLHAYGVDNWGGYDDAMREFWAEEGDDR